ncbi:glycosidase [Marinihelvus fidelis]|uniref:4-O-beta-D-mannosyl-D-glucose phosphorylase n=1 Tax=Marinihelvus fidelis TaxID=2613842 RepID=A0A5N0T673_9GAMM|nr:glycosidase [Marinihelvus fidelis]KAA9130453.1 glycosidase [Marinihelvus fidelis]
MTGFDPRLSRLRAELDALLRRTNSPVDEAGNGIYERWRHPVVTRDHVPLEWRYDLDPVTNPHLLERIGVNSTFNAGAMAWQGKYLLVLRMEGADRKSYFAIAESDNGVDGFRFRDAPIDMPALDDAETNLYDMRLTAHEDGWIYGLFCAERHDPNHPDDPTAALARCGIARTRDLDTWERLPDLVTRSPQQRNVVLHPEFIDGRYGLYTRPQDGFIEAGGAGGLSWGLAERMDNARVDEETVVDPRAYHTIAEAKNGQGPPPIRTREGWLHLAHGVRGTAAGLRYVLYPFLTELDRPWVIRRKPAGHLLAPRGDERPGDVSNVVFCNGWIRDGNGDDARVLIYYASADTRMHVATSSVDRLVDHCLNAPEDGGSTATSASAIRQLVNANQNRSKV